MSEGGETVKPLGPQSGKDTAVDVRLLDSQYQPFPSFPDWERAVSVDHSLWRTYVDRLEQAKGGATPEQVERAVGIAVRSAAVETGAIEGLYEVSRGFTYTVATEAVVWQAVEAADSADIQGHFAAQLEAYELVLDAATQTYPVTQAFTRRVHEVVCGNQDTYLAQTPQGPQRQQLRRGEYKTLPNHVIQPDGSTHSYAPVADTEPEMARLVAELETDQFRVADPVVQASYVHYCLVAIHPFADGNGRVARALGSIYLYRAASIPLVVFSDQQPVYFDTLANADRGDFQPCVNFVFNRSLDAIELVIDHVTAARVPAVDETIADLTRLLTGAGGLLHQDIDAVAHRLSSTLQQALAERINDLSLPAGVTIALSAGTTPEAPSPPPQGYRKILAQGHRIVVLNFVSSPPAQARTDYTVDVVVAIDPNESATFLLRHVDHRDFPVRLADVHPAETGLLRIRLATLAETIIAEGLASIRGGALDSLSSAGY